VLLLLQQNNLLEAPSASPPVFSGTIPDITRNQNTGSHQYDLGAYFSGATSYSISPAIETGWVFDTGTGELTIDTDAVGVFGTYVVTATNINGTDDSNAFSVTVAAVAVDEQASGGWDYFVSSYEQELQRRRSERKKREELEEATEQIQDSLDRQIAYLLREQEAKDDRRNELERLASLARSNADLEAARQYSEKVAAGSA
jgi:hypothetical protein